MGFRIFVPYLSIYLSIYLLVLRSSVSSYPPRSIKLTSNNALSSEQMLTKGRFHGTEHTIPSSWTRANICTIYLIENYSQIRWFSFYLQSAYYPILSL